MHRYPYLPSLILINQMSITEEDGCATFFLQSIPAELLENVLRFFSSKPAEKHWEAHVPLRDVAALYSVKCYSGVLQCRFHTLCISRTIYCADEHRDYGWKLRKGPGILWTNNIRDAYDFLVAGGGKYIKTLVVGDHMYNWKPHADFTTDFFNHCPNITALSVARISYAWLQKFGAQIQELEVVRCKGVSISKYCTALRELNLHFDKKNAFPSGNFDPWFTMTSSIGDTLKSLTLSGRHRFSDVEIDAIRYHCWNLERIHISSRIVKNKTSLLRLLSSYGTRLKYTYLDDTCGNELSLLVEKCKNAKFHLDMRYRYPSSAILKIVGVQLDKIYIGGCTSFHSKDIESEGWGNCVNLRSLDIKRCNVRTMREIMKVPKRHLTILVVAIGRDGKSDDVKEIMDIAADGTGGVQYFTYSGAKPTHEDAFYKFFRNNKIDSPA